MIPRPLYRWKAFWLGILVLAFLGWSWLRSIEYKDWFNVRTPTISGGIGHANARLGVYCNNGGSEDTGWRSAPSTATAPFPSPIDAEAYISRPGYAGAHARLLLAHWFLILLFLIPWTAFLIWRTRQMKHLGHSRNGPG